MRKRSYIGFIKLWGLVLLLSLGISIIIIDVIITYHDFNIRIEKMREDYIEQQKLMAKREVERFIDTVRIEREKSNRIARETVKARVSDAYNIANSIYEQNKDNQSDDEIKKIITDTLRSVRFSQEDGYYFIYSLEGDTVLCTKSPEHEGRNVLEEKDTAGSYYVKDMIQIVEEFHEGYCKFLGEKKGCDRKDFEKVAYVKLLKPYGWIIGTSFYMDDIEAEVKRDFLEQANKIHYGKNGYFIVQDWHGLVLAHGGQPDYIGKNTWELSDSKGTKLVQELIKVSKSKHGGYVNYWWHKPNADEDSPKITFVLGLPEWECYLATGVYLNDIAQIIAVQQAIMNRQVKSKLILFITFITLIIIIFLIFFNTVSIRLSNDFNQFITFFKRAAHSDKEMDCDAIRFSELEQMANSANEMLRDKIAAQKSLNDEKEQLAVTLRSIADGVITTDIDGRVELMNAVAEQLTGWGVEEAAGRALEEIFKIVYENTREIADNPVMEVLRCGNIVALKNHTILISRDGTEYCIADSAAPIRGADSNIHGVVLVFRDVTKQKKNEAVIFNAKKLESIGILAGGIAHDFNNVLTGIFGNIELAKCVMTKDHKAYQYIETAEEALERATNLTKQLLTFAKGGVPILAAVSLKEVVTESVKFNLSGSNVKVEFNLPDDLWQVKADKGQLNQVMANLSINAKQAMPDGGVLSITAENIKDFHDAVLHELSGDYVKLVVSDNGCGIAPKDLGQIFDPYFSTKQSGSGLGLATVQSIIIKHNGIIGVDSTPGNGAAFTILFPAEHDVDDEITATRIDVVKNPTTILGHVLLMDDEEIIVKISTAMLKACGYTYDYAGDGVEALEKYIAAQKEGNPFDVVIMDLTIPGGMGGKEAIDKFLAVDPKVTAIVSSGYSVDPVLANYADYGFKGRLVKPFKMNDLARELAYVLRMS